MRVGNGAGDNDDNDNYNINSDILCQDIARTNTLPLTAWAVTITVLTF